MLLDLVSGRGRHVGVHVRVERILADRRSGGSSRLGRLLSLGFGLASRSSSLARGGLSVVSARLLLAARSRSTRLFLSRRSRRRSALLLACCASGRLRRSDAECGLGGEVRRDLEGGQWRGGEGDQLRALHSRRSRATRCASTLQRRLATKRRSVTRGGSTSRASALCHARRSSRLLHAHSLRLRLLLLGFCDCHSAS